MQAAIRIFYRLIHEGGSVIATDDSLTVRPIEPLNDKQRMAIRAHKANLLILADWYRHNDDDIRAMNENEFAMHAEHFLSLKDFYLEIRNGVVHRDTAA